MQETQFIRNLLPEEKRSPEQVREHYLVERELADRLRGSTWEERQHLYTAVYEELFRRVPSHPQLTAEVSVEAKRKRLGWQVSLLRRFLHKEHIFLEIGSGDCALAVEVASRVAKSVGCDVAPSLSSCIRKPENFRFLQTNGRSFDLDDESVDICYSNQLMEHLHVEDAWAQLEDIFRVLRIGGRYVCITPNRIGGPWDISMYFDREATGLHMKEYTVSELSVIFREVGFSGVHVYAGGRGIFCRVPVMFTCTFERIMLKLPVRISTHIARSLLGRAMLGIRIVAIK